MMVHKFLKVERYRHLKSRSSHLKQELIFDEVGYLFLTKRLISKIPVTCSCVFFNVFRTKMRHSGMLYLTKSTRVTLVLFKLPRQRSRDLWRIFLPRQHISIFPSVTFPLRLLMFETSTLFLRNKHRNKIGLFRRLR